MSEAISEEIAISGKDSLATKADLVDLRGDTNALKLMVVYCVAATTASAVVAFLVLIHVGG